MDIIVYTFITLVILLCTYYIFFYKKSNNDDRLWKSIINFNEHEKIEEIISQGVDINKPNSDGQTPLAYLISEERTNDVKFLVAHGADVCKRAKDGKTPLSIAARKGDLNIVKFLVKNGTGPTIQTAFLDAIESKNFEVVKYMKEHGALANWLYKDGWTPLTKAIDVGDVLIAEYLIENGADLKLISQEERRLKLLQEVKKKNSKMVGLLLDLGVNVDSIVPEENRFQKVRYTALTKAVEMNDFKTVKLLVEKGASINQPRSDGKTALSIAASLDHFTISTFLIDSGADIKMAQAEVDDYAARNEDFDIFLKLFWKKSLLLVKGSEHEDMSELPNSIN